MRRVYLIILTVLFISCNPGKNNETRIEEKSSVEMKATISVDSTFMEFFETFMWNKEFQKSRITFPIKHETKKIINSKDWNHLSFYTGNKYIPILNSDTIRLYEKDVEGKSIEMFIVNISRKSATKYSFIKNDNKWFLSCTQNVIIRNVPDFEFIDFLTKFSNDSIFQINHISFPLPKSYLDSENDYETVNEVVLQKDWKHIKAVELNDKLLVLSNIDLKNKYRNIFYRGVENGIWVKFSFEKINGNWKLIKLENSST